MSWTSTEITVAFSLTAHRILNCSVMSIPFGAVTLTRDDPTYVITNRLSFETKVPFRNSTRGFPKGAPFSD